MGKIRILLVQEVGTMTADILNTLKKSGLDVIGVAETGEDAIRMVPAKEANVVLIDTRLRVGFTAQQTADELSNISKNIHIIYLTFRKEDLPPSSTQPFLLKPFSVEELKKMITALSDSKN